MKTIYKFKVMRGGADGEISVFSDNAQRLPGDATIKIKPNSHYNIDYIMHHYDLYALELAKNKDIWKNVDFREFIKKNINLVSEIDNARSLLPTNPYTYMGTYFDGANDIDYNDAAFGTGSVPIRDALTAIIDAKLNTYNNTFPSPGLDFYSKTFRKDTASLPPTDIPPSLAAAIDSIEGSLQSVLSKLKDRFAQITDVTEKINAETVKAFKAVSAVVLEGDYTQKYEQLGGIIANLAEPLTHIKQGMLTEVNIINNMEDVTQYYENMDFSLAVPEIDGALKVPADMTDMVSNKEYLKKMKTKTSASSVGPMPDISLLSSMLNLRPKSSTGLASKKNPTSYGDPIMDTYTYLKDVEELSPSSEAQILLQTTIYKSDDGKMHSEYLDDLKLENIRKELEKKVNSYSRLITGLDNAGSPPLPLPNTGVDVRNLEQISVVLPPRNIPITDPNGHERLKVYKQLYKVQKMRGGSNKKYGFEHRKHIVHASQTGGAVVRFESLDESSNKRLADIRKYRDEIDKRTIEKKERDSFFDRERKLSVDVLYQENDFLREMQYEFILSKIKTIGIVDEKFVKMNELQQQVDKYQMNLTTYLERLNSRVIKSQDTDVLQNLLATGRLVSADVENFFDKSGLSGVRPKDYSTTDIGINTLTFINTMSTLYDKLGGDINKVGEVMNDASNEGVTVSQRSTDLTRTNDDLEILKDDLADLNININAASAKIRDSIDYIDVVKKGAQKVIERNLNYVDAFVSNIFYDLDGFTKYSATLKKIQKIIGDSKFTWDGLSLALNSFQNETDEIAKSGKNKEYDDFFVGKPEYSKDIDLVPVVKDFSDYAKNVKIYGDNILTNFNGKQQLTVLLNNAVDLNATLEGLEVLYNVMVENPAVNYNVTVNMPSSVSNIMTRISDFLGDMNPTITHFDNSGMKNFDKIQTYLKLDPAFGGSPATRLQNYIKKILPIMGNLSLFPNIYNKINIPANLKEFIDEFAIPEYEMIEKYVNGINSRYVDKYKTPDNLVIINNMLNVVRSTIAKMIHVFNTNSNKGKWGPQALALQTEKTFIDDNLETTINWGVHLTGNREAALDRIKKIINNLGIYKGNTDLAINGLEKTIDAYTTKIKKTYNFPSDDYLLNHFTDQGKVLSVSLIETFYEYLSSAYAKLLGNSLLDKDLSLQYSKIKSLSENVLKNTKSREIKLLTTVENIPDIDADLKTLHDAYIDYKKDPAHLKKRGEINAQTEKNKIDNNTIVASRKFRGVFSNYKTLAVPCLQLLIDKGTAKAVAALDSELKFEPGKIRMIYTFEPDTVTYKTNPFVGVKIKKDEFLDISGGTSTDLTFVLPRSNDYPAGSPNITFAVPFQKIKLIIPVGTISESNLQNFITTINTIETCITLIPMILNAKKSLDGYRFKAKAGTAEPEDPVATGGNGAARDGVYNDNIAIIKDAANSLNDVNFTIMNTPDVFYLRGIKIDRINIFEEVIKSVNYDWSVSDTPSVKGFRLKLDNACVFLANLTVFYHAFVINLCEKCVGIGFVLRNPDDLIRKTIKDNIKFDIPTYDKLLNLADYKDDFNGLGGSIRYIRGEMIKVGNIINKELVAKPLDNNLLKDDKVYRYFFSNKKNPSAEYFRVIMVTDDKTTLENMIDLDKVFGAIVEYVYATKPVFDQISMTKVHNFAVGQPYSITSGTRVDDNLIFSNVWNKMLEKDGPLEKFVKLLSDADFNILKQQIKDDFDKIVSGSLIDGTNIKGSPNPGNPDVIIPDTLNVDGAKINADLFDASENIQKSVYSASLNPLTSADTLGKYVRSIMSFIYADTNSIAVTKGFNKIKYDLDYFNKLALPLKIPYNKFKHKELRDQIKALQGIINTNIFLEGANLEASSTIEVAPGDLLLPKSSFFIFKNPNITNEEKKQLDHAETTLEALTSLLKVSEDDNKSLSKFLRQESEIVKDIISTNVNAQEIVKTERDNIENKILEFTYVSSIITQVMFNKYYAQTPFMELGKLNKYLYKIIEHYTSSQKKIKDRLMNMMDMNQEYTIRKKQVDSYLLFLGVAGKKIKGSTSDSKFYLRMGFGLIDYYWDVIHNILDCMNNKKKMVYDDFSEIEKYFYLYHWITIQQCYKLFGWIRDVYMPLKAKEEIDSGVKVPAKERYIMKKIELESLAGPVGQIFSKFQAIRENLDQYQSVVMQKVSIHLRINDFPTGVDKFTSKRNYAVNDPEYIANKPNRVFTNDGRYLQVHMDKVEDPSEYPVGIDEASQKKFFDRVHDRMTKKDGDGKMGIKFKRIYDSEKFPDASVISNYMSLASNIMQGNGTMLMTYGYSGTGKSFTMFGKSTGGDNIQGILQSTLQSFSNKIYFRTYEIYGLGTRFNSYWNPQNCATGDCPTISCDIGDYVYQMVIHHKLKLAGKEIEDEGSVPILNQHDMLAYIMEMVKPEKTVHPMQTDMRRGYIDAPDVAPDPVKLNNNRNAEFTNLLNPGDQKFKDSVFLQISKDQFEKFDQIVKKIDAQRKKGVTNKYMDEQTFHQIKSTLNNPESSRSILVYEFQIEVKIGDKFVFVPFIIYDLPGKEELVKTYIGDDKIDKAKYDERTKEPKDEGVTPAVFIDFPEDTKIGTGIDAKLIKDKKITLAMNPYLIPAYVSNTILDKIIASLSALDKKLDPDWLAHFFTKKVLDNNEFVNTHLVKVSRAFATNNMDIATMFKATKVINFETYFDQNNLDPAILDITDRASLIFNIGLVEYMSENDATVRQKVLKRYFLMLLIWKLMQYKAIDIIVLIIEAAADEPDSWKKENIHAFFEALYINENVVGLIQYLISQVMNKPDAPFKQQVPGSIIKAGCNSSCLEISKYLLINTIFRQLLFQKNTGGKFTYSYLTGLSVDQKLLDLGDKSNYQKDKISKFIDDYSVSPVFMKPDGKYDVYTTAGPGNGKEVDPLLEFYRSYIYLDSLAYDGNKIFRDGNKTVGCDPSRIKNAGGITDKIEWIVDPNEGIDKPKLSLEGNRPLLQDFLEPYKEKIRYYYLFYLVTNNDPTKKGKEQINLLNNSYDFINILNSADTDACSN